MENIAELISMDPETLGGQAVFRGTRVPVESLFDHLESGITIDEFLEDFPTVTKNQVISIMEIASKLVSSKNISELYASAA